MALRALLAIVILTAFAIPLAAGCAGGGDSDVDDFEATVVDTRDRVDSAFADIADAQTRDEFINRMGQAAVLIGRAADDLEEEGAPDEFKDEAQKLSSALRQFSDDLEGTSEQLRLTPGMFNSEGLSFPGFTKANEVLRGLGQQGIEVRPLELH